MVKSHTEELLQWDRDHIIHPLGIGKQNQGFVVESAAGITIKDTEGKEYIDLASQLVNVNLNHNRREVIEAAKAQMDKLLFSHLLRGYANLPSIELGQKLAGVVPPGLDHFLWTLTGADANDCAIRIANTYWRARGRPKYKIISLYNSYHGTSRGVASATMLMKGGLAEMPPAPGHLHIPNYFCYYCPYHKEYPSCSIECAQFLAQTIENEGAESVSAFIVEPVQGSGGFISPPPEYWPLVREICKTYDVLLISDEVMTGFCRTGPMFAVEHWQVIPDMITMSKGIVSGYLPFGAVAMSGEIYDGLEGQLVPAGSTESGNPICCAVASKCIDIYLEDGIAEHVASLGQYMRERLEGEFLPLPHVGCLSGLGLMLSMGLVKDKETRALPNPKVNTQLVKRGLETGLYLRLMGGRVCIAPPLMITKEEADHALDTLYPLIAELELG